MGRTPPDGNGYRKAALVRWRPADDPERVAAERDHAAARLEEHVRRVVAEAPPLTAEQADRLRALLSPGAAEAA